MKYKKLTLVIAILAVLALLLTISGCGQEEELVEQPDSVVDDVDNSQQNQADESVPEPVADVVADEPEPVADAAEEVVEDSALEDLEEVVEIVQAHFDRFSEDELALGDSVDFKEKLFEEEVDFDGESYTVKTYLRVTDGLRVAYSLVDDEDFEAEPALVYSKDSIKLYVVVKDGFDFSEVNADEPLKLSVLGQELTIVEANGESLKLLHGNEAYVEEGLPFEDVTLEAVAIEKVVLSCNGEHETVSEGETVKLCNKRVKVVDVFFRGETGNGATLRVGEDIHEDLNDGDAFIKDEDGDAIWTWLIDIDEGMIGFEYTLKATKADEAVLRPGESLDLLGLTMSFDWDSEPKYESFDVSFDEEDLVEEYENVLVFEGKFLYGDEEEANKVLWTSAKTHEETVIDVAEIPAYWVRNDGVTVCLQETKDETLRCGSLAQEVPAVPAETYTETIVDQAATFWVKEDSDWIAVEDVLFAESELSLSESLCFGDVCLSVDLENQELVAVFVGEEDLSERDHDVLTSAGIVLENVEDSVEDNELSFRVPKELVQLKVSFA